MHDTRHCCRTRCGNSHWLTALFFHIFRTQYLHVSYCGRHCCRRRSYSKILIVTVISESGTSCLLVLVVVEVEVVVVEVIKGWVAFVTTIPVVVRF